VLVLHGMHARLARVACARRAGCGLCGVGAARYARQAVARQACARRLRVVATQDKPALSGMRFVLKVAVLYIPCIFWHLKAVQKDAIDAR